jgi:DNA-binding NarL/FixJ family response regulator
MEKQKIKQAGSGSSASSSAAKSGKNRGSPRSISVMLVEGQTLFRKGIRAVLSKSRDIRVVGEAGTAAEAEAIAEQTRPDIVLTALSLPDDHQGGVVERLSAKFPDVRVLVLTALKDQPMLTKSFAQGACGYVMKEAQPDLVIKAIRAVHAGETWLPRELLGQLTEELRRMSSHAPGTRPGRLSKRELEVLRLLATGVTTAEIAAQLFISQSTVRVHLTRILEKLKLKNRIEAVRYAIKEGLVQL